MALRWFGDAAHAHVMERANTRVEAATIHLATRIKTAVSRSQPTTGTGTRKKGLDPSKPGEFPKFVIGSFRRSIQWEVDRPLGGRALTGRVGTNDPRGRWFEFGTRKMKRRPWLTLALSMWKLELRLILETGMLPK